MLSHFNENSFFLFLTSLLLILWEILLIPYLKYVQNLTSALCSCSHSDVRHHHLSSGLLHESLPVQSSCLCPRPTAPPHPALSTEARVVTLNVSPCWSHASASHCHFAIPRALVWTAASIWMIFLWVHGSLDEYSGACGIKSNSQRLRGYFPQLYWDVIGIHHCISF